MILVDTHCHLFDLPKDYRLPENTFPVVVGYNNSSNKKVMNYLGKYPIAIGIAPQTSIKEDYSKVDDWCKFVEENAHKANAIGEIGLDYKWAENEEHVKNERELFERMLKIAKKYNKPIVIHSRNNPNENSVPKNAIDEILGKISGFKFLMHFYSGNAVQAKKILEMGGYISISHLRSKDRRKVIEICPLERMVVESDCPYIGKTPQVIWEAAQYIAEVKGIPIEEVCKKTTENAFEFFGVEKDV